MAGEVEDAIISSYTGMLQYPQLSMEKGTPIKKIR